MKRRGLTLVEVVVTLGLVGLLYLIVAFTTVQLSRAARNGVVAARARQQRLRTVEQLRWQLRCLHLPPEGGAPCLKGGRLNGGEQDALSFLTTHPARGRKGVVEACYRLMTDPHGATYLAYREFPSRDPHGLRPWTEQEQAPWQPLEAQVASFRVDYSTDGEIWQREWDASDPPRQIRVLLTDPARSRFLFYAIPGVASQRW